MSRTCPSKGRLRMLLIELTDNNRQVPRKLNMQGPRHYLDTASSFKVLITTSLTRIIVC